MTSRLGWQDTKPQNKYVKDFYEVAQRHERKFAFAWRLFTRAPFVDPRAIDDFRLYASRGMTNDAVAALTRTNTDAWQRAHKLLVRAYANVLSESFADATSNALSIKKAADPLLNPYVTRWLERHAMEFVTEISYQQREAIRQILISAYATGESLPVTIGKIKSQIGLLDRDIRSLRMYEADARKRGVSSSVIERVSSRRAAQYLAQRAENIARTETVLAQSTGKHEAWLTARDEGLLEENIKREWIAAVGSSRTCKICDALNGQQTDLDTPFTSAIIGSVTKPPAHPQCRCTVVLVE